MGRRASKTQVGALGGLVGGQADRPGVLVDKIKDLGGAVGAQAVPRDGFVSFYSLDGGIQVNAKLRAPVAAPVPRPKYGVADRPAAAGLVQWQGRDPFQVVVPVMFDRLASFESVEDKIRDLESLAVRDADRSAPPVVVISGPVPDPIGVRNPRWRVAAFTEVPERTVFNDQRERCRWAVDVTLLEHVHDRLLASSIDRTIDAVGITNRTVTAKPGDSTFYELAKRVLGDRGQAKQIARANGLNLATRLKAGVTYRLP